jgi:hypothetical protein
LKGALHNKTIVTITKPPSKYNIVKETNKINKEALRCS